MKKLILLAPFILIACGPSKEEINKKRADSLDRAYLIKEHELKSKQLDVEMETDSLLHQAKMKELEGK